MKSFLIFSALAVSLTAGAQAYIETNFSSGIPSDFTTVNGDGCAYAEGIYANLGKDTEAAWVAASLPLKGRAALSPTRCDENIAQENLLILPPVVIQHSDAIMRFDARSLHRHLPEAYDVLLRTEEEPEWRTLYSNDAESYQWVTRVVKLNEYDGKRVELAICARTVQGFLLAIDNIFVGRPEEPSLKFINETLHYVGVGSDAEVRGRLQNYGADACNLKLTLTGFGSDLSAEVAFIGCGEEVPVAWPVEVCRGEIYDYTIEMNGPQGPLAVDFMSCSYFPRTNVLDRCSGTWCNNCPVMGLTTNRLQELYGNQLIIVEPHINDRLVCQNYNAGWIDDNVFNIPALIPNHNLSEITYKVNDKDDLRGSFMPETKAFVEATASFISDEEVAISSKVKFSGPEENGSDRYRLAYALLGDFHDPDKLYYAQRNSTANYNAGEWYYQPSEIKPVMMYYDNVPVNGPDIYSGVAGSLPAQLQNGEEYEHTYTLSFSGFTGESLKALALVIDRETGEVLNAAIAVPGGSSAVESISKTAEISGIKQYFDILGREIPKPSGFCIERCGQKSRVIFTN